MRKKSLPAFSFHWQLHSLLRSISGVWALMHDKGDTNELKSIGRQLYHRLC